MSCLLIVSAGIMSTFLHVHPFGANLEYLWSYIQRLDSQVASSFCQELKQLHVQPASTQWTQVLDSTSRSTMGQSSKLLNISITVDQVLPWSHPCLLWVPSVSQVSAADLERLMVRLPTMFRQELSGVGANLEKRWTFCGFDSLSSA